MAHNAAALTTALAEGRRFASFASERFRLVPARSLLISQHEDCIYALPRPAKNDAETLLLSDAFVQGEGKAVARSYFQRLSAGDGKAVCLLDAHEENLYSEPKHGPKCIYVAGGIAAFAVNNAGDTLAVAFCSGLLAFYKIVEDDGKVCLQAHREVKTNTKNVTNICFDSSDKYTACGTVDGAVVVYNDGCLLKMFHHQQGFISAMKFYPQAPKLLAATQNGDIIMYCMELKAPVASFNGHLSYVNDIAFLISEDESSGGFVSCARDSTVCFWSLSMKKKEMKAAATEGNVIVRTPFKRLMQFETVVTVSVVGAQLRRLGTAPWALFVATESGVLRYIDPITENTIMERRMIYGQGDELKCAVLCTRSNELVVLGSSGTLCFYTVNLDLKQQVLGNIDGAFQFHLLQGSIHINLGGITSEDIECGLDEAFMGGCSTGNGSRSSTGSNSGSSTGNNSPRNGVKSSQKTGAGSTKKGAAKHAAASLDAMDVDANGDASSDRRTANGEINSQSNVADWLQSLRWLQRQLNKGMPLTFILCGDEAVRIMALDGWGSCITLGLANDKYRHSDTVLSIAYSPSANILASGGKDEQVFIWDLRSLTVVTTIMLEGLNVACIALPNGLGTDNSQFKLLATGDNVLKSFEVNVTWQSRSPRGQALLDRAKACPASITTASATALKHKKAINAVAFSPNNKLVASAGSDKVVVIYSADNLIVRGECVGHRRSVVAVAFTKVNKTVVSSSVDATIKIWNLNEFSCIKTLQGHTKAVMKVLVLQNDLQLLSVGMDGLVKVWNIKTSDCIFTADNHADKVWSADAAGQNLLTVSGNGVMIWWDDISAEVEARRLLEEREEELRRTQVESLAAEGKHSEAICLAMELRKPDMAAKILKRRCGKQLFRTEEGEQEDPGDLFRAWVTHIKTLPDTKKMLTIAFDFVHLWNSKGSTSWMANCLLAELLRQFKPNELFVVEGMAQRVESILAHQSSHITRFVSLKEKSHLLDIILGFNTKTQRSPGAGTLSHDVLYK